MKPASFVITLFTTAFYGLAKAGLLINAPITLILPFAGALVVAVIEDS